MPRPDGAQWGFGAWRRFEKWQREEDDESSAWCAGRTCRPRPGHRRALSAQARGSLQPLGQDLQLLKQEEEGGLPAPEPGERACERPALSGGRTLALLPSERPWEVPTDPWWRRDEEKARGWTVSPAEWEMVRLSPHRNLLSVLTRRNLNRHSPHLNNGVW